MRIPSSPWPFLPTVGVLVAGSVGRITGYDFQNRQAVRLRAEANRTRQHFLGVFAELSDTRGGRVYALGERQRALGVVGCLKRTSDYLSPRRLLCIRSLCLFFRRCDPCRRWCGGCASSLEAAWPHRNARIFQANPFWRLGSSRGTREPQRVAGKRLVVARNDGIEMYNLSSMSKTPVELSFREEVASVAFHTTDDLFAVGSETGKISLRSTTEAPPRFLNGHKGPITKLAFSPDGTTILLGRERRKKQCCGSWLTSNRRSERAKRSSGLDFSRHELILTRRADVS